MLGVQRGSTAFPWLGPGFALPLTALLLAACGGLDGSEGAGTEPLVEQFSGLVAADEPRASIVGRDVLANGGNAADAAVAMYFTMAVTLPSRTGLGGGGTCLYFDSSGKIGEALVFRPKVNANGGLVPLGVRAMAAMHARHGILRWGELLRPAENLARFGHSVSRAFAGDLKAAEAQIVERPGLARLFENKFVELAGEGDKIVQPELAAVLSGIRRQSATYLHIGPFAQRYAELTAEAGLPVTVEELREGAPLLSSAVEVEVGSDVAYFPPPPAANGTVAAELWQILTEVEDYAGEGPADRAHLFVEASMRAFGDRARWIDVGDEGVTDKEAIVDEDRLEQVMQDFSPERHTPPGGVAVGTGPVEESLAGASFVVSDRFANAAACSFTMNGLFGSGLVAEGTGLILGAPPTPRRDGYLSPTAVVVGNTVNGDLRFAAAASGGSAAATSMVTVMIETLEEDIDVDLAMRAARLHHGGLPDLVFYEKGIRREIVSSLQSRGHSVQEVQMLGRVNALSCPDGVRDGAATCRVVSDPRGPGLADIVQ